VICLFVDTNVIIDHLADRKPFSDSAARLFEFVEKGKARIFVSSLSFSHVYYVVKKVTGHQETIQILRELEALTDTLDVTKLIIKSALGSNYKDFEDAIQYHTAVSNKKIAAIVTRDPKGYKDSDLAVLSPDEAISLVENQIR
jgi:predicted nucleic acid-binding protein